MNFDINVKAGSSVTIRLRLKANNVADAFDDFDNIFKKRLQEADEFYDDLQKDIQSEDEKLVQRQAFAGMLWSKQFFYYDVDQWLKGDPAQPAPPSSTKEWA